MDLSRERTAAGDEALETALDAYFALQRIQAEGRRSLHRSVAPSLVLWVHAWHPLPDLVTWLAAVTWGMCTALAVALAMAAAPRRARLEGALPEARRVVRLQFAAATGKGVGSALFLYLSVAASAALWLHALAPQALRPDVLSIATKSWALLLAAAVANKYFERW